MNTHFRLWGTILFIAIMNGSAQTDPFPVSRALESRVRFWEDIFAAYSENQIVLYDAEYPERIFRVLDLDSTLTPRKRTEKVNAAKSELRSALIRLAGTPNPPDDLLKLRQCFADSNVTADIRRAAHHIRAQSGAREKFVQGYIRSGKVLGIVKQAFEDDGLPGDLAYLAHVESSFISEARSHCGALGMWQLMKGTGKAHLRINSLIDERRDPILSAHAAAGVLKENLEKTGSWPLAVTAYNHGLNGVRRAVRTTGSEDLAVLIRKYRGPLWGNASKNFYAEFAAVRRICLNPENYGIEEKMDAPMAFQEIKLPFAFYLKELVVLYEVDEEILIEMNPAFQSAIRNSRSRVPRGYRLRVPTQARVLGASLITAPVIVP